MASYAELEVSVQPFIVLPLETVLPSDYHIQKSVPCDKVSRQGGSGSKSAQSGSGGGGDAHSCQKLIPSDSFYKTLTCT